MADKPGGLFSGFRKTVGASPQRDDEQARTMLNFGAYKGQLLGTGDTDIARPMAAGRHQFSSEVQAAYEVAGMAVPDDIAEQLEQLDSIAVSSQAVAQMDPLTRVKAIGDGYSEFDTQRMLEAETELMRSVRSAAGQVLTADARLAREKTTADIVGKQLQNATNALTLDQAERIDRYGQILSNTTMEQLATAVNAGTGIDEVPIVAVQSEYARRLTEQAKISQLVTGGYLSQLAGVLGMPVEAAVDGSTVDGASTINMLSRSLTPEALDVIIEEGRKNHDPKKNGHVVMGTIVGPDGKAVQLPVATLMVAKQQLLNQEQEMGESLAKTFRSQATVQASLYDVEMANIFSILQNTNRNLGPEAVGERYSQVLAAQQAFEASYSAGNTDGMEKAVKALQEFKEDLITSLLPPEDDPGYQSAFDNMMNGRPVSPKAVASSLAATAGTGGVALGVTPNSIFSELAPVIDTQIRMIDERGELSTVEEEGEDESTEFVSAANLLSAGSKGGTTAAERNIARGEAIFSEVNRRALGKEFSDQTRGTVAETGLRTTLTNLAATFAAAAQETPPEERGAVMAQLRVVDEMRTMLFGKFPETGTFESGGGSVSGLITSSSIPAEYIEGPDGMQVPGRPLTDPSTGETLISTSIDPARFAQVIDLFDIQLREAGVDLKSVAGFSTLNELVANTMKESTAEIAMQFVPTTLRDKELMMLVSEDYRSTPTDVTGYQSAQMIAMKATADVVAYMQSQSSAEVIEQLEEIADIEVGREVRGRIGSQMLTAFAAAGGGLRSAAELGAAVPKGEIIPPSVGELVDHALTGTVVDRSGR